MASCLQEYKFKMVVQIYPSGGKVDKIANGSHCQWQHEAFFFVD